MSFLWALVIQPDQLSRHTCRYLLDETNLKSGRPLIIFKLPGCQKWSGNLHTKNTIWRYINTGLWYYFLEKTFTTYAPVLDALFPFFKTFKRTWPNRRNTLILINIFLFIVESMIKLWYVFFQIMLFLEITTWLTGLWILANVCTKFQVIQAFQCTNFSGNFFDKFIIQRRIYL